MANYCTSIEVKNLLLLITSDFDANTDWTKVDVDQMITNITGEIDTYLTSVGVGIQPTNTNLLNMLKKYAAYGVACPLAMSYKINNADVDKSQAQFYCDSYQKFLDKIVSNPEIFLSIEGQEGFYMSNQVSDGSTTETNIEANYIPMDYKV